ncbi:MAG: hypothetical protein KGL41_00470 [Actinomycetales bacterium]|nr:hypothetical protein [Actinomycetales bacterium]
MDPALILTLIAVIGVPLAVGIPIQRRNKKLGKKTRSALGAGLSAMNEVFHPAAKEHSIVVEQREEAMAPKPSPEDK